MFIPGQYVFLFLAVLLGESAVLFVYTVIGLLKSGPVPFLIPPVNLPQGFPSCPQCIQEGSQAIVRGAPDVQSGTVVMGISIITSTAVVYRTQIPTNLASLTITQEQTPHQGEIPQVTAIPASFGSETAAADSSDIASGNPASTLPAKDSVANVVTRVITSDPPNLVTSVVFSTSTLSLNAAPSPATNESTQKPTATKM